MLSSQGKRANNSSKNRGSSSGGGASTSKGKGGHGSANNQPPVSPEIPVARVHIKVQENAKLLPKYSAALARPHDDYVPSDDLDAIQGELELLLSTVVLRSRALKLEYDSLDKDGKKDKKAKYSDKQPNSPKRRRIEEKRSKDSYKHFPSTHKVNKVKGSAHSPAPSQHTDDSMDAVPYYQNNHIQRDNPKLVIPKNDVPNKFWLSVEPYCMPITQEDIKLLDDLLEDYSNNPIPPIPELGSHYSTQWAADDIRAEQDGSNQTKNRSKSNSTPNEDMLNVLKKGEKAMGEGITGPLTQRLVSALMEENMLPDIGNGDSNSSSENNSNSSNSKTLSLLKNGISLEKRVRRELMEQGILDADDFAKSQEDEVLTEIKRVSTELQRINEYNINELKKLQTAAKHEMKRLEVKRKLDLIDQEIIELHKKISEARTEQRPITKEERDEVFRLTRDQKTLSDILESVTASLGQSR